MGSAKNRTLEDAEKLAEKLRLLPAVENKKRPLSKQEEVALLKVEIKALQERGYTLDMIAEILNSDGLSIATPTLKSYLNKANEPHKKTTKRQATRKTEPVVSDTSIKPQSTKGANTGFTIREDRKDI